MITFLFALLVLASVAYAGSVNVTSSYVVFAWNDLGMHCLNPTYDKAVVLPPYNDLIVQVVKRGDPPTVVTSGLTVQYSIVNNTYSSGKGYFGQFWTYMQKLFGVSLPVNTGLNLVDPAIHNGLTGNMVVHGNQFEADGIPVTPMDDSMTWNPYQVAQITVKDSTGKVVAQTQATIPTSDEINCGKCHGADPFTDILQKHDAMHGTNLVGQAPVLCASCHGSPVLKTVNQHGATEYLSAAIHRSHSTRGAVCYDCHPGNRTQCSRSLAHTAPDGNCTTCHGDMANVASSIMTGGRIPWLNEPKCVTCHSGVAEVDTGTTLYRNAAGHGGLHCAACHGSPHAMVPSGAASDNYQSNQYQGAVKTIGSCGACHGSSRGAGLSDYLEEHGWLNPKVENGCNICHTQVTTTNTTNWPHQYQWKDSNSTTSGGTTSVGTTSGGDGGSVTPPASNAAITPSSSTVTVGGTVTFTASASGGSGTYEYSFLLNGPGTSGTVVKQGYSQSNKWTWTPSSSDAGVNTISVRVRNAGSTASYETQASCQVTVSSSVRRRRD